MTTTRALGQMLTVFVFWGCGPTGDVDVGPAHQGLGEGGGAAENAGSSAAGASAAGTGGLSITGDTITDTKTGLTWQRILPNKYAGCSGKYTDARLEADSDDGAACSWQDAMTYCSSLGTSWRLPTRAELESIVDTSQVPAINLTMFPGTKRESFWTSTKTADWSTDFSWEVDFRFGRTGAGSTRADALRVRCVR